MLQKQAVCRGGRGRLVIVAGGEQARHVVQRPAAPSHVDERPDQEAHHVVQEAVGLDHEIKPPGARHPLRDSYGAFVPVSGGGGSANGERPERMPPKQRRRARVHRLEIERSVNGPFVPATKGRSGLGIRADPVAVTSRDGPVACVETGVHLVRGRNPHIGGEQGVEGPAQRMGFPLRGDADADCLAAGMHPRVRSAGALGGDWLVAQASQHPFELALHRALVGLTLPTGESGAVVVQHELHGSPRHCSQTSRAGKQRKPLIPIDFTLRASTHCDAASPSRSPQHMSRSLPSLAQALSAAPDLDAALVALGGALADVDRAATVGMLRYDARREMLRERLTPAGARVITTTIDTTFDHLPVPVRAAIEGGGQFSDLGERSGEYARLFGFTAGPDDGGILSLRGIRVDGELSAVVALHESKRLFGTRASERFEPAVALFELAYGRLAEREARDDAVRTLEDVTQRVHNDYLARLSELEAELVHARESARLVSPNAGAEATGDAAGMLAMERAVLAAQEDARKSERRAAAIESQVGAAVSQLEQAHVELHRRSEMLRQKTRTLYLIERVLRLDAAASDPRQLVDGLLALVGDDLQAQRCSLMLVTPDPGFLYLAASRGGAPHVVDGARVEIGVGIAGEVAASRRPLLVTDDADGSAHALRRDEHFTTGSFISFPLVYRDELIGVVNLTNRMQRGLYSEDDIERVQLLALVISLVASSSDLPRRLLESIGVG